jgi:hypothetical protein
MDQPPPLSYESRPVEQQPQRWYERPIVQVFIAFVVIVCSVMLCAAGGGLLASVIDWMLPKYYPSVFHSTIYKASNERAIAREIGIATGVGQGAGAGVLVGLVIALALAIANRHRSRLSPFQTLKAS